MNPYDAQHLFICLLSSAYHIWWCVIWDHLPFFNWVACLFPYWSLRVHCIFWIRIFIRFVFCKSFLPVWGFSIFLKFSDINISRCCAGTTNKMCLFLWETGDPWIGLYKETQHSLTAARPSTAAWGSPGRGYSIKLQPSGIQLQCVWHSAPDSAKVSLGM